MKALVLCGGLPQIALIKELRNRGIVSVLADMNEKAVAVPYADKFYPVSTLDIERLEDIAKSEKVDFIISVCADQMLLVAAQLSEKLNLPSYISFQTAKNVSNKEYMKKIFVEHGIPTSKYIVKADLLESDIKELKFPLIVKPVDAYSSRGVKRVENITELEAAFQNAVNISRTNTAIVEEYFGGEEISVDVYVEDGIAKILCTCNLDKIPEVDKFIICRGRCPATISEVTRKKIADIAQKIADAFQLINSPMLIQLKVEKDEVSVIEFCARTGGGTKFRLIPDVSGFDVVKAVVDLTLGQKPHVNDFEYRGYIINEFLYCKPGVFDHMEGLQELYDEGIIQDFYQLKPQGYVFGDIVSSGDRVAYFSVHAESYQEALLRHKIAVGRIKAISTDSKDLLRHDTLKIETG